MGAFFTNVQVHTAGRDADQIRAKVAEAVRQLVLGESFVEIPGADGKSADRTVLIGPAGPEQWIAVYDEATENQDSRRLAELAAKLSVAVDSYALGVLVHDSDILQLCLYRSGTHVDTFDSAPDYFGARPPEQQQGRFTGRLEKWQDALVPGASLDDLRSAWTTEDVFAEDLLSGISPLLGLNPERATVGYEYLVEGPEDLSGFIRLAYRARHGSAIQRATGLPRLEQGGGAGTARLRVGDELGIGMQAIWATARSVGGPSRGLRLVVWGSALDQGLLEVWGASLVRLRRGDRDDQWTGFWQSIWALRETVEVVFQKGITGAVSHCVAALPDYEIQPGLADPKGEPSLLLQLSRRRYVEVMEATRITAIPRGMARVPGSGELHIGFAPLTNYEAGQTSWIVAIEVLPGEVSAVSDTTR